MEDRIDSAAIIVRSVVSTLTALIIAIGLILGMLVAVSPRFAYDFYSATGGARGLAVSADKLADQADRQWRTRADQARVVYNVTERLPALRLAAERGVDYYGYGTALSARVLVRMRTLVEDADFAAYARAADEANAARSNKGAHIYVTGEVNYLAGEYVRMLYPSAPDEARAFTEARFAGWLTAVGTGAPAEIIEDGGAVALLESLAADGNIAAVTDFFAGFDAVCGDGAVAARIGAEQENVLPAMHIAKTCRQLYGVFAKTGTGAAEQAAAAWKQAFDALYARYTA